MTEITGGAVPALESRAATLVTDDGFGTRHAVDVDIDPLVVGFGAGYRW